MKRLGPLLVLLLFFYSALVSVPRIRIVEGSGIIYIRADGSVDPPTAPIERDGSIYTFRGNVSGSIVVEKNNIILDGAGYTVQGARNGTGINLQERINVTIKNLKIRAFETGVYLFQSSNNMIRGNDMINSTLAIGLDYYSSHNGVSGNNITANRCGIQLGPVSCNNKVYRNNITNSDRGISLDTLSNNNSIWENNIADGGWGIALSASSDYNSIVGNNITNNTRSGIALYSCSYNTISGNTITANRWNGINLGLSKNNGIFHNNLVENQQQVFTSRSHDLWDDGVEGNHWSNYTGEDLNSDGIGDSPHVIDANNTDSHPLMGRFSDFNATPEDHVQTVCNSTISDFQFNGTEIRFSVSGVEGTKGFCRTCIPTALMNAPYKVFVNGTEVLANLLPCSNSTNSYLYFNYKHTIQEITIIPEFPSFFILASFMIATLLAITIYRRKRSSKVR